MTTTNNCSECKKAFPIEELITIKGELVCGSCKPIAIQRIEESQTANQLFKPAGFGIRFKAAFFDGLICSPVNFLFFFLDLGPTNLNVFGQLFGLLYGVYFVGKWGATPGKMLCKIKIIRTDHLPVSYGLATGRYFAQLVSFLTLGYGYIMIIIDKEYAQGLHDKICKTLVVYKDNN